MITKIIDVEYVGGGQMKRTICFYPGGTDNLKDFADYVNSDRDKFITFTFPLARNCVWPYYIEDESMDICINSSHIVDFWEESITVLSRTQYKERLKEVVQRVCTTCANYADHSHEGDDLDGHWNQINLDGVCRSYEPAGSSDEAQWEKTEIKA